MSERSSTVPAQPSNVSTPLLLLEYNGRQTVVHRPKGYQVSAIPDILLLNAQGICFEALQLSLRRSIPWIPNDHDQFAFETNELDICPGQWTVISEEAWETVLPLIRRVRVVSSSSRDRSQTILRTFSSSQASPSAPSVERPSQDGVRIFIRDQLGITYPVSYARSDTIGRLKERIEESGNGPSPDAQKLMYAGWELEDCRTLTYYGIGPASVIDLVPDVLKMKIGKPVIYLYPPISTRISTKLSIVSEWGFSAIYPVVVPKTTPRGQEIEWVVDASPGGVLKGVNTDLEVSYLYWEAE